jgi:hypothetical protein
VRVNQIASQRPEGDALTDDVEDWLEVRDWLFLHVGHLSGSLQVDSASF